MSAIDYYQYDQMDRARAALASSTSDPLIRSKWQPVLMSIPVVISGASIAMGGVKLLSDISFVAVTLLSFIFLISELRMFNRRFGIGGITLFSSVLIWQSYDYLTNWAFQDFGVGGMPFGEEPVCREVFYACVFIWMMTFGLRIRKGKFLARFLTCVQEPENPNFYLFLIIMMEVIGLSPYLFFTHENFLVSMWKAIVAGRSGGGTEWTTGRTGNVNFSWGAYLAQVLEVGQLGGILASFHLFFLARSSWQKILDFAIWALWLAFGFGTGARTDVAQMAIPMMGFAFLRFSADAADQNKSISTKAYAALIILFIPTIFLIQTQITFRGEGFSDADLSQVSLTDIKGNSMFSEALQGFAIIPAIQRPLYDKWPGAALVLPIPNTIFWGAISPIPRALWTSKPIDPEWEWYNSVVTGRDVNDTEGTTVSQGMVGTWYFGWGPLGVIEGGLFVGWLMLSGEMALQENRGKPIAVLMAVAFETWLFHCGRGITFFQLHGLLVGMLTMSVLVWFFSPLFKSGKI